MPSRATKVRKRVLPDISCYMCGFPVQPMKVHVVVLTEGPRAGWYEMCSRACAQMLATLEQEARRG